MRVRTHLPFRLARVALRQLRPDDLDDLHAYRNDADTARLQGWSPMSHQDAAEFIAEHASLDDFPPGVWAQLAVADLKSNQLVGDVGVHLAPDGRSAEFGLSIAPENQRRGLGTEVAAGTIRLLLHATQVDYVTAATDARNVPCRRALLSAGMVHVETREREYKGELCMEEVYNVVHHQ